MSDYCKIEAKATYSESSTYQPTKVATSIANYEITPDEGEYRKIEADTGGTTAELGTYVSITCVIVKNRDDTNYVAAAFTDLGSNACSVRIPAGGILVIPGIDPTADLVLTANTAAVICEVFVAGT